MRGGYRAGAGRKKGFAAKNAEEARKYLSQRVAEEMGPIADALIQRAMTGDIRAIHELLDRAWGRPTQAIQITPERLPVPIMGLRFENMSDEDLHQYALTDDERAVLERRLLPKTKAGNTLPVAD
ncbi:hypothetical protein A3A39_02670 [Candidatus Kaiserbacteria bacterium RIFCSPLOWO2_01_FULL_54_13]|uniref:Uncharacterized protein n=1 Tax=Candidatus Kaiserbacteria bacterium RIFCSPLOWO2_01_FULL_54_13 TaxID=1798512 RepID=A0A1F6F3L1_9BACT|nr:MAG: hypothetical protein A3A39_02670 [Candidatus Kaiserbacteria bacterium RIFCSPLOWO2_01_FULL_54_13]